MRILKAGIYRSVLVKSENQLTNIIKKHLIERRIFLDEASSKNIDIEFCLILQKTFSSNKILQFQRDQGVYIINSLGLSKSRNFGLTIAQNGNRNFIHFIDQETEIKAKLYLEELRNISQYTFENFIFHFKSEKNFKNKSLYNNYLPKFLSSMLFINSSCSPFLLFFFPKMNEKIKEINFNQKFGVGSKYRGCEEAIFVSELIKNGAKHKYLINNCIYSKSESQFALSVSEFAYIRYQLCKEIYPVFIREIIFVYLIIKFFMQKLIT